MPKARPISQQRKRRVRISKASPFPVPIETVTGETASISNWIYYTATLQDNNGVVVHHSGDMDFLYRMGFFGKGNMSRAQPQWAELQRMAVLPLKSSQSPGWQGVLHAKVMNRRRYMMHLKWHLLATGDNTVLNKVQQDLDYLVQEPKQNSTENPSQETGEAPEAEKAEPEDEKSYDEVDMEDVPESKGDNKEEKSTTYADWGEGEGDADFWGMEDDLDKTVSKKKEDDGLASWDTSEGDPDFWGADNTGKESRSSNCTYGETSLCTHYGIGAVDSSSESGSNAQTGHMMPQQDQITCKNGLTHGVGDLCSVDSRASLETKDRSVTQHSNGLVSQKGSSLPPEMATDIAYNLGTEKSSGSHDDFDKTDHHLNKTDSADACSSIPNESTLCDTYPCEEWSEFCDDGEEDSLPSGRELLFVIPDSDEEEIRSDGQVCRMRTKWKPVVKLDPFRLEEHLYLSNEEAFFLSYGLGCLSVLNSQKMPMTLHELWREFCQRQPDFLSNYIAYHYYRSKNWVPKTGLKFGCNFLLYKDGPPFYHGSYSVVVKFVDAKGKVVEGCTEQRQFSWTSLAGLKRITEHVGKELIICYVIKPLDMTPEDMLSPACISRFQVKETQMSRWVSSQEREGKPLEDIP